MPQSIPVEWAAGAIAAVLGTAILLSLMVVTLAAIALYLQKQNLERLVAMSISRRAADTFMVGEHPTPAPRPKAVTKAEEKAQVVGEMKHLGLDPNTVEDRLAFMERAAGRA